MAMKMTTWTITDSLHLLCTTSQKFQKTLPLFLSYGGKDLLSDVKDVKHLLGNLKDHDSDKLVVQYIKDYAHADFVFGIQANRDVYDPMMAFFRRH